MFFSKAFAILSNFLAVIAIPLVIAACSSVDAVISSESDAFPLNLRLFSLL